jgi:hypothetical protein
LAGGELSSESEPDSLLEDCLGGGGRAAGARGGGGRLGGLSSLSSELDSEPESLLLAILQQHV